MGPALHLLYFLRKVQYREALVAYTRMRSSSVMYPFRVLNTYAFASTA